MKRTVSALLLCLLLTLSACAGERVAQYSMTQEVDGVSVTDTLTLNARGDKIYQITIGMSFDLTDYDGEVLDALIDVFRSSVTDVLKSVEGIDCTDEQSGGVYTVTAVCPAEQHVLDALSQAGVLQFSGNSSRLSLRMTEQSLEQSGYTKIS